MSELILILLSIGLIIACGLFVAAEFALITVDRSKVARAVRQGDQQAVGVQTALKTLSTQLSGAQIGITITNLAIGYLAQPSIASLLSGPLQSMGLAQTAVSGVAVVVALLLATIATMLFGELIPKNIALAMPLETARRVQYFQRSFSYVMTYPIRFTNGIANAILRKMHIEPREELASARSAEELSSLVKRSADKGFLPQDMALMIERSLSFGDRRAEEVMTPRARVISIESTATAQDVIKKAKETGFSRLPVIGDDIDHIVGIVHIKHAVRIPQPERAQMSIKDIMKKPVLVPSNIQLDPLLTMLRKGGLQMAVLIDEFGGTDGIVTIEDLIEELVGEVQDEHDYSNRIMKKQRNGTWLLSGLLRPDEASHFMGVTLPEEEEFETLGGLITERLEKLPKQGDAVTLPVLNHTGESVRISMTVQRMDDLRVDVIEARLLKSKKKAGGNG